MTKASFSFRIINILSVFLVAYGFLPVLFERAIINVQLSAQLDLTRRQWFVRSTSSLLTLTSIPRMSVIKFTSATCAVLGVRSGANWIGNDGVYDSDNATDSYSGSSLRRRKACPPHLGWLFKVKDCAKVITFDWANGGRAWWWQQSLIGIEINCAPFRCTRICFVDR